MSILKVVQPSISQNEWNVVQSQRQAGSSRYPQGVAILLLDAENIKLCAEEERFLETCCNHSLQIKIAFANWRAVCKQQDVELNERGYQMIHVPAGKNSADLKMTAIGSSLFMAYPNVKEVLVCSSDADLIHLCNTLRIHGLAVHAVRKQSGILTLLNLATGQFFHSPQPSVPLLVPSMAECLQSIKALIQSEQNEGKSWIKLSELSKKFQEVHGFTLSYLMHHHEPGKKARDLFSDRPTEFVMHQLKEQGEIYVCLFTSDLSTSNLLTSSISNDKANSEPTLPSLQNMGCSAPQPLVSQPKIKSRQSLEKVLLNILKTLTLQAGSKSVKITELLSQFQKQQGQPVSHFLKALAINQKTVVFLKTCPAFKLELREKVWEIDLTQQ